MVLNYISKQSSLYNFSKYELKILQEVDFYRFYGFSKWITCEESCIKKFYWINTK